MTGMDGSSGILKADWKAESYNHVASSVRLDEVVASIKEPICMLKADVEGYEPQVLHTAQRVFAKRRVHTLQLEMTKSKSLDQTCASIKLLEHLDAMGYRFDIHDVIRPEDWKDAPDPLFYITARYRRSIENMVRTAPEQYFWMHRVWKSRPRHERLRKEFPDNLKRKMLELPWMDEAEVERIVEQSERDIETLDRLGGDRLE